MANVFDVAKYILDSVGEMSTMKLQKLCYYSLAWYMVWNEEKPLFPEKFLRFDNGPVCKELFDIHKRLFYIDSAIISKNAKECLSGKPLSEEERRTVDQIIEDYGKYTGSELSEITHLEDPWKHTKKDSVISNKDIYSYYSKL